ncbi:unnamed protein product [Durusdinium trenchii]|uniref:USP domain-containing protein n=1 Tax=Durusdinium trenchii TaxID=1381693 RepID=A0ABP0INK4_9DINO
MEQHDVQELCRVLFDALERSSSLLSEVIRDLYSGQMTNYTRCKEDMLDDLDRSSRPASYMDLQVPIQDCKTLEEALRNFTEPTLLSGDNQWLCDARTMELERGGRVMEPEKSNVSLVDEVWN